MELESKKRHLPFLTAMARAEDRYKVKMPADDFIEKAYYIWRTIGNIATVKNRIASIVPEDLVVNLPLGAEFICSVTTANHSDVVNNTGGSLGETSFNSSGTTFESRPDISTLSDESSARSMLSYTAGEDVNYVVGPNNRSLRLTAPSMVGKAVVIVYDSIDADEDGLPLLNDKEVAALASNMALQKFEGEFFINVPGAQDKLAYITPIAERELLAARISEKISDNALDKILDIKSSWNRKTFGNKFNWTT